MSLTAWWKFDEPSGTSAEDSSGGGFTATLANGAVFAAGLSGNAVSLAGGDDSVTTASDMISSGDDSISAWIFPRSFGVGSGRIIDNGNILFYVNSTGEKVSCSSNGAVTIANAADSSVVLSTWQHVCLTRSASGVANFYRNGVLSGSANQASGTPAAGTTNVFIGNRSASDRGFVGRIDELRIYSPAANITFPQATAAHATLYYFSTGEVASGASKIWHIGVIGSLQGAFTGALSDTITIPGHSLIVDDRVAFFSGFGSSLPTGISEGTVYWVVTAATDTIEISTTQGGSALNISAVGRGVAFKVDPIVTSVTTTPILSPSTTLKFE